MKTPRKNEARIGPVQGGPWHNPGASTGSAKPASEETWSGEGVPGSGGH